MSAAEPAAPAQPREAAPPRAVTMGETPVPPAQPAPTWRRFLALDLLDNRYPALHGVRVLAIVAVVQFHVTSILDHAEHRVKLDADFIEMSLRVFFGMDLFFILSGFLIGSILLRSLQLSGTQNIRRFYLRRAFRTFPSYYLTLTALALVLHLTPEQRHNLPYEYVYLTNFVILHDPKVVMGWGWSLALEEQFYLGVPLLFFVLHRLRSDRLRLWLLGVLWISALVVRLVIYHRGHHWTNVTLHRAEYFNTYTRFDTLVAGIVLAFVHAHHKDALTAWLRDPAHRALLAMVSLSFLWLLLRPTMFGPGVQRTVFVVSWGTTTSLMYFPALILLLHGEGWVQRALSIPIFRRAATLGYGVYLVHIPVLDHVVAPLAGRLHARHVPATVLWPASLVATLGASFVIGYAMHLLIEKPSLWVRERLAR